MKTLENILMKSKLLIILLTAISLCLSSCKDKKLPQTDPEIVQTIAEQWCNALNNKNIDSLKLLYADDVLIYGVQQSKAKVVESKADFVSQHPDFKQTISGLTATHIDQFLYRVDFAKNVSYGTNKIDVKALLLVEKQGDKWLIVSESDEPTEIKLEKERKAQEEKERKAIETARAQAEVKTVKFEQNISLTGKLSSIEYEDFGENTYTAYILTLDKPINVTATSGSEFTSQNNVSEIQVGFNDNENPKYYLGKTITITGDIYGEQTVHHRRPVIMIWAAIEK